MRTETKDKIRDWAVGDDGVLRYLGNLTVGGIILYFFFALFIGIQIAGAK